MFTILPSLVPNRLMLAVPHFPRGFRFTLAGVGYIVRAASHKVITDLACALRLLLEKQQDYLNFRSIINYLIDFTSHELDFVQHDDSPLHLI